MFQSWRKYQLGNEFYLLHYKSLLCLIHKTCFWIKFYLFIFSLPEPVPPRLDIMTMFVGDSFAIAMVAFAVSLSMAKLLSKKHKYVIRPNQVVT